MGDFIPRFERIMDQRSLGPKPLPTSGAIQSRNEKGEMIVKKVKVNRHVAGQMPKYADRSESDDEDFTRRPQDSDSKNDDRSKDRRHDRRRERRKNKDRDEHSRRKIPEPEYMLRNRRKHETSESSSSSAEDDEKIIESRERRHAETLKNRREREHQEEKPLEPEDVEEDDDEESIQRRRDIIRMQQRHKEIQEDLSSRKRQQLKKSIKKEEELLKREEEKSDEDGESSEEESSEESESSEEESAPMLKPVFVKKRDRVTLIEMEAEEKRLEQLKVEEIQRKEERKKESVKIMEETLRREEEMQKAKNEDQNDLTAVNTDDEDLEVTYELWKVREMKRLKRDRDERETIAREKAEIEKVRNMTEEERKTFDRINPKTVTNKASKGKYKFLQKYYHRGAFFLDKEDDVYKRDFAEATGEDEFDKSVLPKVMQVKNFGKASRSKWTHLTAEDTTDHQGVWAAETPLSSKFVTKHSAGMKAVFDRPAAKKRKVD